MSNNLYFRMARERRKHLQHISRLEREVQDLSDRLMCYHTNQSTIPPIMMTNQVREWMDEFGLPWEVFYCYDHKQWVDELDYSFPYNVGNRCPNCRENEE